MKVYISGPITGHEETYIKDFKAAEALLKNKGHVVLNPAIWGEHDVRLSYDEYMKLDLSMLEVCDAAVFLPGWEASKGCNIERNFAKSKNIKIMELQAV